ncbi:MAG TPA: hypothetical protein VFZ81_12265 [Burkholderiales bacterium]
MKFLKPLFAIAAVVFFCGAQAATPEESFQGALQRGMTAHPSQYSFADIYRLTVSGPALGGSPLVPAYDTTIRIAVTRAPAPAQFSVAAVPPPQTWLLLLSGLALAAWVARRRLGYSF